MGIYPTVGRHEMGCQRNYHKGQAAIRHYARPSVSSSSDTSSWSHGSQQPAFCPPLVSTRVRISLYQWSVQWAGQGGRKTVYCDLPFCGDLAPVFWSELHRRGEMWRCHTAVLIEPWELRLAGHLNFDDEDGAFSIQDNNDRWVP